LIIDLRYNFGWFYLNQTTGGVMQAKYTASIALLILFISLSLPLNSFAQREPKSRIPDDRLKNRLPLKGDEKPRERPGEKENPPIKKRENIPIHHKPPERPPHTKIPTDGGCKLPVVIYYPIDDDIIIPEPDVIKPNYKLDGIQKYKDGDYNSAFNYLNIAIEEDTNDYELYNYRGLVELKLQFFEEAKNDFTKYLEYFFYEPDGYFQRGLAKFYLNEKEDAKSDFQIAAEMDHKMAISILKRFY